MTSHLNIVSKDLQDSLILMMTMKYPYFGRLVNTDIFVGIIKLNTTVDGFEAEDQYYGVVLENKNPDRYTVVTPKRRIAITSNYDSYLNDIFSTIEKMKA